MHALQTRVISGNQIQVSILVRNQVRVCIGIEGKQGFAEHALASDFHMGVVASFDRFPEGDAHPVRASRDIRQQLIVLAAAGDQGGGSHNCSPQKWTGCHMGAQALGNDGGIQRC